MYRLDVTKDALVGYAICVYREGFPVEDYLLASPSEIQSLIDTGTKLLKGLSIDDDTPEGSISLDVSHKHGNAYQLIVRTSESYVKVFILTEVELKLFLASLKRAVDG